MKTCKWLAAAACLSLATAHAEGQYGPRVAFPIVMEQPTIPGGTKTAPDAIAYQQAFRSQKALRLTADHIASYTPPGEKKEVQIKLPAGTLFVLARGQEGDVYCASRSATTGVVLSYLTGPLARGFEDAGICLRDSKHDGHFDQEAVINQGSVRTRTAYEILSVAGAEWKSVDAPVAPVAPADIPAGEIRVTYEYFSGGLIGKARGVLHLLVCWPKELQSADDAKAGDESCAVFGLDIHGEGVTIGAAGTSTKVWAPPFTLEAVTDKDKAVVVSLGGLPEAGPAVLAVSGRLWRSQDRSFQRSIVDIYPPKPPAAPAPVTGPTL